MTRSLTNSTELVTTNYSHSCQNDNDDDDDCYYYNTSKTLVLKTSARTSSKI